MHDPNSTGNDFFKCDFCRQPWREDRPMVEGHQGSLICANCLSVACADVAALVDPYKCTMCLREPLEEPGFCSPAYPEAFICEECIEQAASTLSRDPDSNWSRPA